MAVKCYQDLIAWQKALDLVVMAYELTKKFPREETYGLCSQLRKAAVSIPSNIAEGQGRRTKNEFTRFLLIAYGSLCEVETQVHVARRLSYCSPDDVMPVFDKCGELGRLINGLINSISESDGPR